MKESPLAQDDWELDLAHGLPVSRLTVTVRWRRLVAKLSYLVRASGPGPLRIIDIGGGTGEFFAEVKDCCASYLVVEPSKSLLAQFTPQQKKHACRGFGERLPCPSQSADVVVIKAALDHCFDPQVVLAESYRVLAESGEIFILLTNDAAWYKRMLSGENAARKKGCRDHNFFFNVAQVADLLENAGFQCVRAHDFDYLRLPVGLENLLLEVVPAQFFVPALEWLDRLGARVMPQGGGSFICTASKGRK